MPHSYPVDSMSELTIRHPYRCLATLAVEESLPNLVLLDEGRKFQLSDIMNKLVMRWGRTQRFLRAHGADCNLFNFGRHPIHAQYYRELRVSAFSE